MGTWRNSRGQGAKNSSSGFQHEIGRETVRRTIEQPNKVGDLKSRLQIWATAHPGLILDTLRRIRPILRIKGICIATSYQAVTAVLSNHKDFGVLYGPKMRTLTDGMGFFLGQDDDDESGATSRTLTEVLFPRDDAGDLIPARIEEVATFQISQLSDRDDLVTGFLRPSVARFACAHFGLNGVDESWLYQTTETLFEYIFIDLKNDAALARKAEKAGAQLREILDRQIAEERPEGEDTLIARGQRLITSGLTKLTPSQLRNNLFGLLIGLVPTTSKAAAMAFDFLTVEPQGMGILRVAAKGDNGDFRTLIQEGMRLHPINPGLFRVALRDTKIPHRIRAVTIPKGTVVFAATQSAMKDPTFVPNPKEIVSDRPPSVYLNDGLGLHACFGRYMNLTHVSLLIRLLVNAGFSRVQDETGNLEFVGPFPTKLAIERRN